ncbi:grpE protein homolog 2, mitochondrial [Brachyhypopomus gauderio]|uniref:grpE protein homolog 2, mitochondrial n=1 Tax=Brachyhypopomus gauderio TaxID=698409 RepID=UPI0040419755
MAVRFLSLCVRNRIDLGRIRSSVYNVRFSSTAAEQRSTGNDCHGYDDGGDHDQNTSVARVKMLEKKAIKLEEQVQDLTERYKKAVANSDTVQRRTRKFVEDAKLFGIQSFCRDLVEVADMLEQTSGLEAKEVTSLTQSLEQIQDRLQEVFIKHGLEKMRPVGTVYDPYQHEVVCHIPAHGVEPGLIAVVKQEGYMLHGRTIRHAHVGIALKTQDS